jgi:hypothetical protein
LLCFFFCQRLNRFFFGFAKKDKKQKTGDGDRERTSLKEKSTYNKRSKGKRAKLKHIILKELEKPLVKWREKRGTRKGDIMTKRKKNR